MVASLINDRSIKAEVILAKIYLLQLVLPQLISLLRTESWTVMSWKQEVKKKEKIFTERKLFLKKEEKISCASHVKIVEYPLFISVLKNYSLAYFTSDATKFIYHSMEWDLFTSWE